MEYWNKTVCVSKEELVRDDDGEAVILLESYRYYIKRNLFRVVKEGLRGSYTLIDWLSIPPKYKQRYIDKYGDPVKILTEQRNNQPIYAEIDAKAEQFFALEYPRLTGIELTEFEQREYVANASALNWIIAHMANRRNYVASLGRSPKNPYEDAYAYLRQIQEHTIDCSLSRFKVKVREYKRDGYISLVTKKKGNANTVKLTQEAQDWIVAMKRSRTPVYTDKRIFEMYNELAEKKGWKQIKDRGTIRKFLQRPEIMPLWYGAAYGEYEAKMKFSRQHRTKMPSMRDALWYGDGTKLNLYYKAYDESGTLRVRTTQVYEVMDAYSEAFLGYCISDSENFDSQHSAYRMAIETAGHRPYEIVVDNQGGHKAKKSCEFFELICRIQRFSAPYNAPSKTIESAFGRFQKEILSTMFNFTGMNITATDKKSRANIEFISANHDQLPTLDELKAKYAEARNQWNWNAHHKTKRPRMEMYKESINPEAPAVSDIEMVNMFWKTTEIPSTYKTRGITITLEGTEHHYEVYKDGMPDLGFYAKNIGRKFITKYDPNDMTKVRLYTEGTDGSLVFVTEARPFAEIHRATQEQADGERSFITAMDIMNKKARLTQDMEMAELETKHGTNPEQHGFSRPRLKGISMPKADKWMEELSKEKPKVIDIPMELGTWTKEISNYDEYSMIDKL